MTQVVLKINNKEKWNALKTVLEAMGIDYITQDPNQLDSFKMEKMSDQEFELLKRAENDKESGRVSSYTSHRDILGR